MAIYLSEHDIRQVLTMDVAIEQVQRSFSARALGHAFDLPRERARLPGGHLHIMQAAAPEINVVGYKAYYMQPDKSKICHVHLINREQGNLEAILEGDWMGRLRTGAATAVAARHLAREDATVLGLFGYGRHAVTQLEAVSKVRRLSEVKVFGRNTERVAAFCAEMAPRIGTQVRPAASREETVRGADMVVAMTRATEPLFDGHWLEPGQFIAATGANSLDRREIDIETTRRADLVVVDSREVAQRESGDLLPAIEAGLLHWEHLADLGEIITKRRPGRTDDADIVLFESHGMALQDLYTGVRVLELARAKGLGVTLPMS